MYSVRQRLTRMIGYSRLEAIAPRTAYVKESQMLLENLNALTVYEVIWIHGILTTAEIEHQNSRENRTDYFASFQDCVRP
jgi:hypothetical protein